MEILFLLFCGTGLGFFTVFMAVIAVASKSFLKSQDLRRRVSLHDARLKMEAVKLIEARQKLHLQKLAYLEKQNKLDLQTSELVMKDLAIEEKRHALGLDAPDFNPQNYDSP